MRGLEIRLNTRAVEIYSVMYHDKEPCGKLSTILIFHAGKELYACSLAISSFQAILDTLGGPNEKERARFGILI